METAAKPFDEKEKMVVEKWPLVQAHALQDAGLKYQIHLMMRGVFIAGVHLRP